MKKVFVDANIILDVLLERKEFMLASSNILALQIWGKAELYTTALTFANVLYVCRKALGKQKSINQLKTFFKRLHVAPLGQPEYDAAMLMDMKDIEDNLQYCSAVSAGCDVLVTRNIKDFPSEGAVRVMLPHDFLDSLVEEK